MFAFAAANPHSASFKTHKVRAFQSPSGVVLGCMAIGLLSLTAPLCAHAQNASAPQTAPSSAAKNTASTAALPRVTTTVVVHDEVKQGYLPETVTVGTLNGATLAETPLSATVVTRELLNDQAARLLSVLAEPFEVRGHRLLLSASIGIALFPEHGIELRELQERADRAMYAAKAQGRNQAVVFSTGVARRELLMQEITRDLPQALTRNQMKLWFQPVVRRNGTLSGFEALVRWIHPLHGSIPPADFIPLVERSGDSAVLDEWVLHEACRRCARWNERGRRLGVAVNVSAGQIEQPDFALRVLRILDRTGLDPVLLTIELTERSLVQDKSAARQQLADLRRYGVHVALDDFGTGYSSLSYLTTLPVDTIKLDRSFLSRDGETTAAVVEAVIEMAHRIGLSVIAEGVETIDQVERLRRLECDEMQGFYYSPPIPWGDVEGYVDVKSSARVWQPEEYCVPA